MEEEETKIDPTKRDKSDDPGCDMELAVIQQTDEQPKKEEQPTPVEEEKPSPLIMSADKAVSTYGIPDLEDYQRAVTYELVFNSLLEKKMLAMKRDCEERKRAKRLKRKSIGRIFFAKRLFSSMDSRKTSASLSEMAEEEVHARTEPSTPQKTMKSTLNTAIRMERDKSVDNETATIQQTPTTISTTSPLNTQKSSRTRSKTKSNTATSETTTKETTDSSKQQQQQQQADDSVTSTISTSSAKDQCKQSLLVKAQTHMPHDGLAVSSSSGDSKNAQTTTPSNGLPCPLSLERTQDTASLASGYENGTGARLHSSTMAEDSLTSIRDSIESLSFASSRCTVSFGNTEIIPEDVVDVHMYERLKAAKRQRIMDAKSISAQCSPILQPRHTIKTLVHAPMSPPITHAPMTIEQQPKATTASVATPFITTCPSEVRTKFLTNQYSFADSVFESRNISRQNTSEDSANLTVSTLLNQSDSLSLHYGSTLPGRPVSITDRFKSKSTGLLVAFGNGRTRPPPLPPPPFETAQHSPVTSYSPTTTLAPYTLPIEQLQQLQITSNIRQSKAKPITLLASSSSSTNETTVSKALSKTATPPTLPQSLHIVTVTTATATPLPQQYAVDTRQQWQSHMTAASSLLAAAPSFVASTSATTATTIRNGTVLNGAIVTSSSITASDTAKLHRMTSTSTGSSIGPTGCCTTTKSSSRVKDKQRFKPQVALGQSGSDDEYRKKKRKYSE